MSGRSARRQSGGSRAGAVALWFGAALAAVAGCSGEGAPWYRLDADVGWAPRPGFQGMIGGAERGFDKRGFLSVDSGQVAAADRPAAVFLGDEITFGTGVPVERTFVELLHARLPRAGLVNLAVPGYSSFQGRAGIARALALQPDVLVVAFGFNDRRGVPAGVPDGNVDSLDYLALIAQWGSPCSAPCTADIDGPDGLPDGNVDALDYLRMIGEWGTPCQ